ncbi:nickel-dependent hydrogenase large subunit [Escherichia coli]
MLNLERLLCGPRALIDRLGEFIEQVYEVDAAIIAAHYPEWLSLGQGAKHYLSVPELPTDADGGSFLMPGGYIENGNLAGYRPIESHQDAWLMDGIAESNKHAWYKDDEPLKPWEGKTEPNYTGWQDDGKYSWVKSPTFYGKVVEVGPVPPTSWLNWLPKHPETVAHLDQLNGIYSKRSPALPSRPNSCTPPWAASLAGRCAAAC